MPSPLSQRTEERYYDPVVGRFISPDPIGFLGGLNLYDYVGGDPVNAVDPTGTGEDRVSAFFRSIVRWVINHNSVTLQRGANTIGTAYIDPEFPEVYERNVATRQMGKAGSQALEDHLTLVAREATTGIAFGILRRAGAGSRGGIGSTGVGQGPGGSRSLAQVRGRGYYSRKNLKRAIGSAGITNGIRREWHHIVEETPGNVGRFGRQTVHNTSNVISLPKAMHDRVSAVYNSVRPRITGSNTQTVRDWLRNQSWEEQRQFGFWIIREVYAGRLP